MSYMVEDTKETSRAVSLNAEGNIRLRSVLSKCGLDTKTALISRMLTWLDSQDEVVIGVIAGTLPPSYAPDIAEMALKKIAEKNQLTEVDAAEDAKNLKRRAPGIFPKEQPPELPQADRA